MPVSKKAVDTIEIKPIEIERVKITIVGDTPLIVHAWSEKAKRQMLEKQMKTAKVKGHEIRNPAADFIHSMYWITPKPAEETMEAFDTAIASGAKFGFPVNAIKQAAISGAFRCGAIKDKMSGRGTFFIEGIQSGSDQLAVIEGEPPVIREDMVKVGMGTADLRYRGEFRNWHIALDISYNRNAQYSLEQIINMVNAGGFVCGIGEWRPEKDGVNGRFHVAAQ